MTRPREAWPALVLCVALSGAPAHARQSAPDPEAARATVNRWVETRQLILKEQRDWEQAKEVLEGRIGLLQREIAELESRVAESRKTASEASGRARGVSAEIDSLKRFGEVAGSTLSALEQGVRLLHPILPEPLQQKVAPLFDRMPREAAASKVSLAERLQNVLGILNEINKSNTEITLTTEIRELSGGKPSEVQTVYVGLGQAYYLSRGGQAGIGRPAAAGWAWEPSDGLAPRITQVIEILQSRSSPAFVALPVSIQ